MVLHDTHALRGHILGRINERVHGYAHWHGCVHEHAHDKRKGEGEGTRTTTSKLNLYPPPQAPWTPKIQPRSTAPVSRGVRSIWFLGSAVYAPRCPQPLAVASQRYHSGITGDTGGCHIDWPEEIQGTGWRLCPLGSSGGSSEGPYIILRAHYQSSFCWSLKHLCVASHMSLHWDYDWFTAHILKHPCISPILWVFSMHVWSCPKWYFVTSLAGIRSSSVNYIITQ